MANTYDKKVILDNLKIDDVLREHNIKLTPSGKGQVKCSIRNGDTQASCSVNLDKGVFQDFGSGVGGTVINLVAFLDLGIDHKLNNEQFRDVCTFIGDKYGFEPASRSYGTTDKGVIEEWKAPDKYVYDKLGLVSDSAIANLIDLRTMSASEASKQFEQYKTMPLAEFAKNYKSLYIELLYKKAIPSIYASKCQYQFAILRLANEYSNGQSYNETLKKKAEKLYADHIALYNAFEKVIPYEIKTYGDKVSKDYSIDPYQFNVYKVEDELKHCIEGKYQNKSGKVNDYMMQFGNVPYKVLKYRATEDNPVMYINTKMFNFDEVMGLRKKMSRRKNKYNFAAISNGRDKVFKVCALKSDMEQLCTDFGVSYMTAQTNPNVFNHPTAQNVTEQSDFGYFFKCFCFQNGKSVQDVANDLGVDGRRISEVTKYNVSNEPKKQELLQRLKDYTGYAERNVQSLGVANYNNTYRRFTDLSPQEQDVIVNKYFNRATNTDKLTGAKIMQKPQIKDYLIQQNQKFVYDANLSRVSDNQLRTAGQRTALLVETLPYNEIARLSDYAPSGTRVPYTITIFNNDAATQRLVKALKENNVSFSFWQQGTVYKLHLVKQKECILDFMKASVKAQFPFLDKEGKIQEGLHKMQESVREALKKDGEEYPNPYVNQSANDNAQVGGQKM